MAKPSIKPCPFYDLQSPSKCQGRNGLAFLAANAINGGVTRDSDVEMVALKSFSYTSLKDLMPAGGDAAAVMSPSGDSWREIPIRDPLLQHAAWAYLQPMTATPESHHRSFFSRLKDSCCGCFGGLLNGVGVAIVGPWLPEGGSENDECEEAEDDGKVD